MTAAFIIFGSTDFSSGTGKIFLGQLKTLLIERDDAREAAWALEDALIRRFGALPNGDADVTLRTDNARVYASELYRELARSYGLHQEFTLPHAPEQNGVAESFMETLKLECVWQQLS